jgi:hypothetical protein
MTNTCVVCETKLHSVECPACGRISNSKGQHLPVYADQLKRLRALHELQAEHAWLGDDLHQEHEALRKQVLGWALPLVQELARSGLLTASVRDESGSILAPAWTEVEFEADDVVANGTLWLLCRRWRGGALADDGPAS